MAGLETVSSERAALAAISLTGDAAVQVRPDVLRLGGRRVVHVAADVEVVVVLGELLAGTTRAKPGTSANAPKVETIFSMCSGSS